MDDDILSSFEKEKGERLSSRLTRRSLIPKMYLRGSLVSRSFHSCSLGVPYPNPCLDHRHYSVHCLIDTLKIIPDFAMDIQTETIWMTTWTRAFGSQRTYYSNLAGATDSVGQDPMVRLSRCVSPARRMTGEKCSEAVQQTSQGDVS